MKKKTAIEIDDIGNTEYQNAILNAPILNEIELEKRINERNKLLKKKYNE